MQVEERVENREELGMLEEESRKRNRGAKEVEAE